MSSQLGRFTPTEYLVLEVLAARSRLGTKLWPVPSELHKSLRRLDDIGLIWFKSGVVESTYQASLTPEGAHKMGLVPFARRHEDDD